MVVLFLLAEAGVMAQEVSKYIVVDQFGYLPGSRKVAVMRNPRTGFDADESFSPGSWYAVVNATTGEKVYRAKRALWKSGITDGSSGDQVSQFDFSVVSDPGTYYILDEALNVRSYEFVIAPSVFNEVLREAMRTFFYQRVGFEKAVPHADEAWADGASHVGDLQDNNCRSWFAKSDPSSERDVSGGWYDAGDYNKYTNWTANYVVSFMQAYLEKPDAWGDDYNIPGSGNGMPDILDEAIYGIDHLLRMQNPGGSVLSIVGEAGGSPPSSVTAPSYYGPPNTSATFNTAGAFAIASRVYRDQGLTAYADTLLQRAILAYDWGELYPDSLFYNNSADHGTKGLGAGQQETGDYGRTMAHLEAACFLFRETGDTGYQDYFDAHYRDSKLYLYNGWASMYETGTQNTLLYYTTIEGATAPVKEDILQVYRDAVVNSSDNLKAYTTNKDPYLAFAPTYVWGSNGNKSGKGNMNYQLITYGMADGIEKSARDAAEVYVHNLHGVNPLNMVYLSNMVAFGADHGVNEFYHSWFTDGSALWDRVGTSVYGPAPGFLTGGPNPQYDWDGCCPSGCGSGFNNAKCTSESLYPPKGQPDQKSYKDFNTNWPVNSWSVTENSCGYQVRYIQLLSKFVTAGIDCNGEMGGTAFIDSCGRCAGGSTGVEPSLDPGQCEEALLTAKGDTMFIEGRYLYSAAGEKVILRGVNEMFAWSDDRDGSELLPEIAQTGANCVRLVWTREEGDLDTLMQLIENCIGHHMIAMPECHSATGEWDKLETCINFWKDPVLVEGIQRNRRWTLVNIGNEVGDGSVTEEEFKTGYMAAIDSLRGWGYTVPLVIDACNWGQDVEMIFNTWEEIQAHDPLHNILFSVHSYWGTTGNYDLVATEAINNGLPVIIGEGPSPTRYPDCTLLDYSYGLTTAGQNEIGWLTWSWGGVPNGHCYPYFDHTYDGKYGRWRTPQAEEMMVGHDFSLLKSAERPASFYKDGVVKPSGIYLLPAIESMTAGDSVRFEVLVTPVNAENRGHEMSAEVFEESATFDPFTGVLIAVQAGMVRVTALSGHDPSIRFSREIDVSEIPVSSITIDPDQAAMEVGDTLRFQVTVLPEDATIKEYYYGVSDTSIVGLDQERKMVLARAGGTALIEARWLDGDIKGTLEITVSDPVSVRPGLNPGKISFYPNPNNGMLYLECSFPDPVEVEILEAGGKLVMKDHYSGRTIVDTGRLSPGIYMVVHTWNGFVSRQKLIIY